MRLMRSPASCLKPSRINRKRFQYAATAESRKSREALPEEEAWQLARRSCGPRWGVVCNCSGDHSRDRGRIGFGEKHLGVLSCLSGASHLRKHLVWRQRHRQTCREGSAPSAAKNPAHFSRSRELLESGMERAGNTQRTNDSAGKDELRRNNEAVPYASRESRPFLRAR